jgi:DNA-binding response OmpR family regulator
VRVLVVDSDANDSLLLQAQLREADYEAVGAATLQQAVEVLETQRFDVVLLELPFHDGNGRLFCSGLREHYGKQMVIIVITSQDFRSDGRVALELGADDFILKPWSADELLARIEAQLRRSKSVIQTPEAAHNEQ